MPEMRLFNNGEFELHVKPVGDSFEVAAPGLARALGFAEARDLIRSIPDREKGSEIAPTPGGNQRVWHVKEPGFYRAIGQRQPGRIKDLMIREQVIRFQDWVYGEVLPALRRTGEYRIEPRPVGNVYGVAAPDVLNYDEVRAELRQYFGISLTVNELTRNLRAGGVLKQNGTPTKKFEHLFWFTGSAFNIHRYAVPQLAYKVHDTGRELQDFRFIQSRLELDGVGQDLSLPPVPDRRPGAPGRSH